MKHDALFTSIYKNIENAASYGGVQALYTEAKKLDDSVTLGSVKQWLSGQDTYTLHKQATRNFMRNRIYVTSIDQQWEIDLADLSAIKEINDNYKFLLTCIDVLSKYAWVEPLKNKNATSICQAFKRILTEGRKPWTVRSDKGSEFVNKDFQKLLKNESI
jgi:hypothetical protein